MRITKHEAGSRQHGCSLTSHQTAHKCDARSLCAPEVYFTDRRLESVTAQPTSFAMPFETVSELRVRYAETDQMGVVYHANYLVWCEIGRTDFIRTIGTPYAQLERDGVMLAVSDASLRFHASARYDDPIRVFTRLTDVRSRSVTFDYRIEHADRGVVLVRASTALVSIAPDGRLISMPAPVRAALAAAIYPGDDE